MRPRHQLETAGGPPGRFSRTTLARLLRLARPEAGRLAVATVFLAIGSVTSLLYPQGVKYILDEAIGQRRVELIDRVALAMVVVFLVQGVAVAVRYMLFNTAGERVVTNLREQLFRTLVTQEVAFFDTQKTGELSSRLASDTTVLQNAVSANISMALRNLAGVLGGIAFLFYTSPVLTLLMLATVPPVALGAMYYGRRVRRLSREVQDSLGKASDVAVEALSGIRTVRSFAAEQMEADRYAAAVQDSFLLAKKRITLAGLFIGGASFAAFVAAAVVFWYGGRLTVAGDISVGSLTAFLVYSMMVAFSLGALSDLWADFNRAAGSSERIFQLLDRAPAIPVSGGLVPSALEGRVEYRGLSFAYPSRSDVTVLDGLDLTLAPGEVVALVGPSGGGKSTIASLLYRLYDPTQGRVLLDGRDLRELDPEWLRRQVGVVAQEPLLFSTTIAENIRYGRQGASEAEVEQAARLANAHEFIAKFPEGYRTQVGERGIQLSGGQKQRVAIARAVLKNPKVLILDEATSALDAESEHLVREALDRLMKGRTTLVIAHRLSTVKDAHRVAVLESGRVVQSGSHAALMREEGLYRRLVERQFAAGGLEGEAVPLPG